MAKLKARVLLVLAPLWSVGCETLNLTDPKQNPPVEIMVSPNMIEILVGGSATITAQVLVGGAPDARGVFYSSSTPAVATVDQAGRVTCITAGSALILVNTTGASNTWLVDVRCTALPAPNLINVTPSGTITVQVNPNGTNEQVCTHQVTNVSEATVTTAYAVSSAAIRASANGHTIPPGGTALVTFTYRGPQSLPLNADATFVANGANGTRQETKVTYNLTPR